MDTRDISPKTQVCGVIGKPVGHSLSPVLHNAAFAAAGLDYVYVAFEVDDIAGCMAGLRAMAGFRGLSVTIPHKETILPHLDEITPLARHIGSVNTVTRADGFLVGDSTDGPGTMRAFSAAGVKLRGKKVVFLGSGGAVRAVAFAMAEKVSEIRILGRTPGNVSRLVADLAFAGGCPVDGGSLEEDLEVAMAECDVVVQGTPMGMYPHAVGESCVPAAWLRREQVVFDMVYRPLRTRLIQDAEAAGCTVIPGHTMLANQAELQFEQWTGRPAPEGVMAAALLEALNAEAQAHTDTAGSRR